MSYDNEPVMPNKFLMPDGSIQTFAGAMWAPADAHRAAWYVKHQWFPAKWLLPDGSIVSGLPLDMTPFEAIFVPKTTKVNGHALTGDITLTPEDIGLHDVFEYKGVIDCSTNPNYPAADAGWAWKVSVAGRIGGVNGKVVEAGDTIFCNHDATPAGDEATVGTYWDVVQANWDIDYPVDQYDFLVGDSSPVRWSKKTLSEVGEILEADIEHNNLQSLQGGTTNQFYHLPQSEYNALVDVNAQLAQLQTDGSPVFVSIKLTSGAGVRMVLISDADGNAFWSDNIATTGNLGRVIVGDGLSITPEGILTVDEPATDHNYLNGLQGGESSPQEYYHLTSAEHTVVQNTSGVNTGDQASSDFDHNSLTNTHNLTTDISHNDISGLQGGQASPEEYYHLPKAEHDALVDANAQLSQLQTDGSPQFKDVTLENWDRMENDEAGVINFTGAITASLVERYVTSSVELTVAQCRRTIVSNYGMTDANCDIELPPAEEGLSFLAILPTVRAKYVHFVANNNTSPSDNIFLSGVEGSAGGYVGVASGYVEGTCAQFFTFKKGDGIYAWFCLPIFGTWVAG